MPYEKHYVPLESDPDIFTELIRDLGVSNLRFTDVCSLDDEFETGLIPRPVLALILIFPDADCIKTTIPNFKTDASSQEIADNIIWFKQTIHNACGLYALLHAVCNSSAKNLVQSDSIIARIIDSCHLLDPPNRAKLIHDSEDIQKVYNKAALQGRTEPPDATGEVDCHYVCFAKPSEHTLWLLDGDCDGPMKSDSQLGSSEDILGENGRKVIQDFIKFNKLLEKCNVGIMALVPM